MTRVKVWSRKLFGMLPTANFRQVIIANTEFVAFPEWQAGDGKSYPASEWIEGLILHESSGNPRAVHVDKVGSWLWASYGLGQIEGSTAVALLPGLSGPGPLFFPLLNIALTLHRLDQALTFAGTQAPPVSAPLVARALGHYNGGAWGAEARPDGALNDQPYVDLVLKATQLVAQDRRL